MHNYNFDNNLNLTTNYKFKGSHLDIHNANWTTAVSSLNPSFVTKKANSKVFVETNQFWGGDNGGAILLNMAGVTRLLV